jgi:small-conductance mechanosensitive channel
MNWLENFYKLSYTLRSSHHLLETLSLFLGFFLWHLIFKFSKNKLYSFSSRWIKKSSSAPSIVFVEAVIRGLIPTLYMGGFYFLACQLALPGRYHRWLEQSWMVFCTVQVALITLKIGFSVFDSMWKRHHAENETMLKATLIKILQGTIWVLTTIFILDNLGFNISAAVAGLGIGGVAIALASQNILGDLFNYFVIFFDRPFEVGDTIHLNDLMGKIEHIGLKTTRIRALSGEQIIISNTDLASSRIRNYKSMQKRRVLFTLDIGYDNSDEDLKKITSIIKTLIEEQPKTRYERGHFQSFGEVSLVFEFVYFVLDSDYNFYMSTHEKIMLSIKESFAQQSIELAFPKKVPVAKPL